MQNSVMGKCLRLLVVAFFIFGLAASSFGFRQAHKEHAAESTLDQLQENVHQVHCSRERSRAAWKIIDEYLMPFVKKEQYQLSIRCKLHPDNDIYRDQEEHKTQEDINEWKCGYCKKVFYEEKYLDKHFDNRHYDLLNTSQSRCLADLCGALHCDLVMGSVPHKTKCNPAATARNKHLCESIANGCFPVKDGPSARRLNEFFLRQFCDAHSCTGRQKPFPKGGKKQKSILYIISSVLVVTVLLLFYGFMYMYWRGIKTGAQALKRISKGGKKKS